MTASAKSRTPGPPAGATPPIDWRSADDVARVSEALRRRAIYRDAAEGAIGMVQTHISSVFLTPDFVFKFKRPVDLGFADFRRLARRRHFCREELRLNRRLARDVYLDVLPLGVRDGRWTVGADEQVLDYMVVMRRLPAEHMMDAMLRAGRVTEAHIQRLAGLLARFHARPPRKRNIADFGAPALLRENWDENFRQVRPYIGRTLDQATFDGVRARVEGFLTRQRALLARRVREGRIRDGHGDLRCEHILLQDELRIIDCIEFNARFRYGDVANDLAFLLMDLAALGRPQLSRALLAAYVAASGDTGLVPLIPFYACYRAWVRGKVMEFKLDDRNLPDPERARIARRAVLFFNLAQQFAERMAPPALVIVCGLMGTGKSTLARALARRSGAAAFSADVLRKAMAQAERGTLAERDTRAADFGAGIYTPVWNARTYAALLAEARATLAQGNSVILDASFARRSDRAAAARLAGEFGAELTLLECTLPAGENTARLRRRSAGGASVSDGRAALLEAQRAAFEPLNGHGRARHIVLDRREDAGQLVERLLSQGLLTIPPAMFAAE